MTNTKTAALLAELGRRWLTPLEAAQSVGILSLAQRISGLRAKGYEFHQRTVTTAGGSRVAAYRLKKKPGAQ